MSVSGADCRNVNSNLLGTQYLCMRLTMAPSFLTNSHAPDASWPSPNGSDGGIIETEFLIVGAGPAGAALACFLSSYGGLSRELLLNLYSYRSNYKIQASRESWSVRPTVLPTLLEHISPTWPLSVLTPAVPGTRSAVVITSYRMSP